MDCEVDDEFSVINDKKREEYVIQYLERHPLFAEQWFRHHFGSKSSENCCRNDDQRNRLQTNDTDPQKQTNEQSMVDTTINQLLKDNKYKQTEDEESLTASYAVMAREGRNSVTCDLFRDMVKNGRKKSNPSNIAGNTESQLIESSQTDEDDLLIKLIKDITNELDIDTLCHKILVNVSLLTQSDRVSLFLAKGSRDDRYLVAKLFDVTSDSLLTDALSAAQQHSKIPFGSGIAGHVALTKENVNITDAYQDERFNKEVDFLTGYHTKAIMCQPIVNFSGDVIGVAQCINKRVGSQQSFSKRDEQVFQKYLTFCGIGIQNAQLFEMSIFEYKRNQLLLSLARSIFEETLTLDLLIKKIMIKAQTLLKSDICRVYLVDFERQEFQREYMEMTGQDVNVKEKSESSPKQILNLTSKEIIFSSVFQLNKDVNETTKLLLNELNLSIDLSHIQNAKRVASEGQTHKMNEKATLLSNMQKSSDGCQDVWVVSVPILNNESKVIGVSQLVKIGQQFNEVDISTLEAFAVFCGLGIHNCLTYERAMKLTAKQKVALEVLSYHASATLEESNDLMNCTVPEASAFNLYSFEFSDFELTEKDTCLATIRMFFELKLITTFKIAYQVLCRWVLSVKKNYRQVKYHNWRHALNVTQTMFAILTKEEMCAIMTDNDVLGLIVASLCHDLDHRGTNNSFQTKVGSPLATLYGTSIMENHHFNHCILILNTEGNNILQSLSPEDYREVIQIIESCILSTDLDQYFQKKRHFEELISGGAVDWGVSESRQLLKAVLMTACDISATFKPWPIQKKIAELVTGEFFEQGDLERQLNEIPVAMMDRDRQNELPLMQVSFIDLFCLPIYKILSDCWPSLSPLYSGCLQNRQNWKHLSENICID